jgi:hypothetical protein
VDRAPDFGRRGGRGALAASEKSINARVRVRAGVRARAQIWVLLPEIREDGKRGELKK